MYGLVFAEFFFLVFFTLFIIRDVSGKGREKDIEENLDDLTTDRMWEAT